VSGGNTVASAEDFGENPVRASEVTAVGAIAITVLALNLVHRMLLVWRILSNAPSLRAQAAAEIVSHGNLAGIAAMLAVFGSLHPLVRLWPHSSTTDRRILRAGFLSDFVASVILGVMFLLYVLRVRSTEGLLWLVVPLLALGIYVFFSVIYICEQCRRFDDFRTPADIAHSFTLAATDEWTGTSRATNPVGENGTPIADMASTQARDATGSGAADDDAE
jgi:hypothetical protein